MGLGVRAAGCNHSPWMALACCPAAARWSSSRLGTGPSQVAAWRGCAVSDPTGWRLGVLAVVTTLVPVLACKGVCVGGGENFPLAAVATTGLWHMPCPSLACPTAPPCLPRCPVLSSELNQFGQTRDKGQGQGPKGGGEGGVGWIHMTKPIMVTWAGFVRQDHSVRKTHTATAGALQASSVTCIPLVRTVDWGLLESHTPGPSADHMCVYVHVWPAEGPVVKSYNARI